MLQIYENGSRRSNSHGNAKRAIKNLNPEMAKYSGLALADAFLVPFLIAGTLVTIDFYKHGYHDLEITHNETIREHQPSDVWDCLGYGLFFGGLGGTGAGLLGLGGYACFLVCQKLSASKTIR